MSCLIAVLTCDRFNGHYLPATLNDIDRHGGAAVERRVYVDGDAKAVSRVAGWMRHAKVSSAWQVLALGPRAGSTEAMRRLLVHTSTSGADLLFFEDDLLFCRYSVARMLEQAVPRRVGVVSFFDMKEVRPGSSAGLYRRPARGGDGTGLWGAQALKFPAEIVMWLAVAEWNGLRLGSTRMASDLYLGELLARHPTRNRLAVHVPNLVQHVGHCSACFPGAALTFWRSATNFPGREFDARSLPRMD